MHFILVYVTASNRKEADNIASHLLKRKLIACANIFPISSSYWWNNKIEKSQEVIIIAKTKRENWNKIKDEVTKIHSYKVPCIIKIEVEANTKYENWLKSVVD
jgi:periplasmic divalent cation tolerance protein